MALTSGLSRTFLSAVQNWRPRFRITWKSASWLGCKRRGNGGYCKCSGNVAAHELRWMNASYFHPAFSGIMKASEVGTRERPGDMLERRRVSPGNLSLGKLPHFTIGSKRILRRTKGWGPSLPRRLGIKIDTSSNTRANKLSAPIYHSRRSIIRA